MRGVWRRLAWVCAVLLVAATAGVVTSGAGTGGATATATSECPVDALKKAKQPVTITFWEFQTAEDQVVLQRLVSEFESSQSQVRVKLVNQPGYPEMFDKYKAGLSSGDLPDVAQFEETTVQSLIDSKSTVPMSSCIKADHYDTSDFLPRTIQYYTTQNVQRSMPWNVSTPVLIYNKTAFRKAGLDPEKPPRTLDDVREDSKKLVAAGFPHGIALHVYPYVMEFLYAKSGLQYVNNGNGRKSRATKAQIDSKKGLSIWSWWGDMVKSGLALSTGAQENNFDHLFALGNGNAAMTIEASSAIGPALAVLATGQFSGTEFAVAQLPALTAGGGVPVGDGSLWIPKASSPEKRAAAWKLIKFLSEPARQAELSVGTGYIPVRKSAVQDPGLEQKWAQTPYLRVPYDQLESGPTTPATVGSVIGNYQGVRDAVRDGVSRMLTENVPPKDALARAQRDADTAISDYNARVGS